MTWSVVNNGLCNVFIAFINITNFLVHFYLVSDVYCFEKFADYHEYLFYMFCLYLHLHLHLLRYLCSSK